MKILVCGGRRFGEFSYREQLATGEWREIARDREMAIAERWTLHYVLKFSGATYIIQGNARGADRMAQEWGKKNNVPHSGNKYTADWEAYGKAAGQIRNKLMLDDNPDIECVYAFEGGSGTANMVLQSHERGIDVVRPVIRDTVKKD